MDLTPVCIYTPRYSLAQNNRSPAPLHPLASAALGVGGCRAFAAGLALEAQTARASLSMRMSCGGRWLQISPEETPEEYELRRARGEASSVHAYMHHSPMLPSRAPLVVLPLLQRRPRCPPLCPPPRRRRCYYSHRARVRPRCNRLHLAALCSASEAPLQPRRNPLSSAPAGPCCNMTAQGRCGGSRRDRCAR